MTNYGLNVVKKLLKVNNFIYAPMLSIASPAMDLFLYNPHSVPSYGLLWTCINLVRSKDATINQGLKNERLVGFLFCALILALFNFHDAKLTTFI